MTGAVMPNGSGTSYHFEYGTSDAYGGLTVPQGVGEGFDPAAASANLSGLRQGTTYHYRLVAINAHATTASADRTFTTPFLDADGDDVPSNLDCDDNNAAVHPGAVDVLDNAIDEDCVGGPAVNGDRDGDGATRPGDCNDNDPRIKPGAVDVPQNGVNEDCHLQDAAYPVLFPPINARWRRKKTRTRVLELTVSRLPAGVTVEVRCGGRGCPLARRKFQMRQAGDRKLTALFRRSRLLPGARLEVRLSAPSTIGRVAVYAVPREGTPGKPDPLCLTPGAEKPGRCPAA